MNKTLSSSVVKIAAIVVGFLAAVSFLSQASTSYNYYLELNFYGLRMIPPFVSLPVFFICAALFLISVWKSPKNHGKEPHVLRKIDWTLLAVLVFCFIVLCVSVLLDGRFFFMTFQLLLFSAIVYTAVMLFFGEVVARARDGQLINTLYWYRFFRLYPVTRIPGFLMAALLLWDILILFYLSFLYFYDIVLALAPFSLAVFTLIVLSYICSFVLTLSAEYDRANAEKIRSERFKAELITNVSHDIRTPLTAVISYVDLLKALPVENPEFTEYVEVLDKKTVRLKTLIDDLMEASKAGTGNLSVDPEEVDFSEITGQVAGEFDELFTERKLTFVFRQPDYPVLVLADRRHLWRALENIFGNAAKYAMPGTRVFIEIVVDGDAAVLSLKNVSSAPIDFPAGVLTEQFIRGDRARQTEGNGLGLYIAKSLVELMGGEFTVSASGDLFEVEIRLVKNPEVKNETDDTN